MSEPHSPQLGARQSWGSPFGALLEPLPRESEAGARLHLFGDARRFATAAVSRPFLREVEAGVNRRVSLTGDVSHEDADLAVVDLAEPDEPLPLDADRLGPPLGERREIEDDHGVGLAGVLADLAGQGGQQRRAVPGHLAGELLQALAFPVMKVGDRLAGLAFELGQGDGPVLGGVPPLPAPGERLRMGLDERVGPLEGAPHQLGGNLRPGRHLFQSKLLTPFRDRPPPRVAITGGYDAKTVEWFR